MEVHFETAPLRRRRDALDPGHVTQGHWVEQGDYVVLTDSGGVALTRSGRRGGRWEFKIPPGADRGGLARALLREKYYSEKGGSDFNRPLRLPPISIA